MITQDRAGTLPNRPMRTRIAAFSAGMGDACHPGQVDDPADVGSSRLFFLFLD
jgi:hypothetical protein